jgi:hypothetical protein
LYLSSLPKNVLKDENQLTTLTTWAQQAAAELYGLSQSGVSKGQRVEKTGTPWGAQFKVKLVRIMVIGILWHDGRAALFVTEPK